MIESEMDGTIYGSGMIVPPAWRNKWKTSFFSIIGVMYIPLERDLGLPSHFPFSFPFASPLLGTSIPEPHTLSPKP